MEKPRVVILAEAGGGKSREMGEQARRLVNERQYAFFVPLESLHGEPLTSLLEPAQVRAFETWKTHTNEPAWFFLDEVDELKLTNRKLDRALLRLSREIDGHLDRARVIISCRPSDWRPSLDLSLELSWSRVGLSSWIILDRLASLMERPVADGKARPPSDWVWTRRRCKPTRRCVRSFAGTTEPVTRTGWRSWRRRRGSRRRRARSCEAGP